MYRAITFDIEVTVEPFFLADRSDPAASQYVWAYRVTIDNQSDRWVKLLARHWEITDARGKVNTVDGPGVVGEQPELEPGDSFQYTSGCPLTTPSGFMVGRYDMRTADGTLFSVDIPAFSLDMPTPAGRTVN
ncbi:MAG TPA: Co2+/Mg2+ efflux protein ApaG [Tianweitania sediminis]|jgi:ApaG protein|nr:Co2+/Mg2+ efflux protein ApaG [Tianweitania sediminis]